MEQQEFYSIQEVALKLQLSQKSIRRFVATGELESVKIGSSYRIPKGALEKFINLKSSSNQVSYNLFGEPIVAEPVDDSKINENQVKKVVSKGDKVHWVDISKVWDDTDESQMTFVDLFCGAGGLSRGLEMAGLQGICGLDFFKEAGMTYQRNFHHPFVYGDITLQESKDKFYETVKKQLNGRKLNVVAGGFPCQGFSMAGNRIVDDPRNSLYKEMLEIVKNLQPDFVICENVKGLRSMLGGAVERKIIEDYKAIGYEMNVTTLCAADYYTPQKRERVIFIGNRIGATNYHPRPLLKPD
jgi:DNA (cytosine-5)-methyltransferase 1